MPNWDRDGEPCGPSTHVWRLERDTLAPTTLGYVTTGPALRYRYRLEAYDGQIAVMPQGEGGDYGRATTTQARRWALEETKYNSPLHYPRPPAFRDWLGHLWCAGPQGGLTRVKET